MSVATLRRLAQLADDGASVIFEKLPEDVPGYGRIEARRVEFKSALSKVKGDAVTGDVLSALAKRGIPREDIALSGVSFIRRTTEKGHDYFFANLTGQKLDRWVALGSSAKTAAILDPLTGASGAAALRTGPAGHPEVYLQLAPGQSLIVRTSATTARATTAQVGTKWPYRAPAGSKVVLEGSWKINFLKVGPELPPAIETGVLRSWTDIGGDEARRFAGTARYRLEFVAPKTRADDSLLDLGDVREVARVRLNGRDIATAWSLPFEVRLGDLLKPGVSNVLELDVTNLPANRIRDLDQRKVDWKIMREINFVNINYKPFDASGWSLQPSGLLGPVSLTPLRTLTP